MVGSCRASTRCTTPWSFGSPTRYSSTSVFQDCLIREEALAKPNPGRSTRKKPVINQVKIEGPRLARCRGYVRELLPRAPKQHVDE